jgi:Ca2+/Na+ antiporter
MVMFGLLFIFGWSYLIVSILFGISLVISPIIRIIQGKFKKEVLKKELPYIVIGILVFFIPFTKVIGIIIKVFGGLVILYSIFMIVMIFVNKNKDNNNSKGNTNNSDNIIIDAEIRDL